MVSIDPELPETPGNDESDVALKIIGDVVNRFKYPTADVKDVNMVVFVMIDHDPCRLTGERLYAEDISEALMAGKLRMATYIPASEHSEAGIVFALPTHIMVDGSGTILATFLDAAAGSVTPVVFDPRPSEDEDDPVIGD